MAKTQHSVNEVEVIDADGKAVSIHQSEFTTRDVYREEMALLLRLAGYSSWETPGGFDRRPLTRETDSMALLARA